jgi:DNA polymerase-3 subunit alpha
VLYYPEKVAEYTEECRDMGIRLLPPDVNESNDMFSVRGENIRYGLVAVKNIGRGFIKDLMAERKTGGPFRDFEEFCRRMYGGDLNRRALESLVKCGGFDSFGVRRRQLMMMAGAVLESVADGRRRNIDGQLDLFGAPDDQTEPSAGTFIPLPDVPEFSQRDLMAMEHEVTGLYLTGHPMDEYASATRRLGAVGIGRILANFAQESGAAAQQDEQQEFRDEQQVTIAGVISAVKTKTTRNNSLMAYITLEDGTGSMELLAFQRALDTGGVYVKENLPVYITGKISARDEKEPQLVVDTIRPLSDFDLMPGEEAPAAEKKLYVKVPSESDAAYERLKLILVMFPGEAQMVIYFEDTKKRRGVKCVLHEALIAELNGMFGRENVVLK